MSKIESSTQLRTGVNYISFFNLWALTLNVSASYILFVRKMRRCYLYFTTTLRIENKYWGHKCCISGHSWIHRYYSVCNKNVITRDSISFFTCLKLILGNQNTTIWFILFLWLVKSMNDSVNYSNYKMYLLISIFNNKWLWLYIVWFEEEKRATTIWNTKQIYIEINNLKVEGDMGIC